VNHNNIYNGGNTVSSNNVDRRATLPLVSSKNIIENRHLHNNLITVSHNANTIEQNTLNHNQTTFRQNLSPQQSSILRKDSTPANQNPQILFNNLKSSKVLDNQQPQRSNLILTHSNSTLRPSSRSISK
jgi:hypothetical protein